MSIQKRPQPRFFGFVVFGSFLHLMLLKKNQMTLKHLRKTASHEQKLLQRGTDFASSNDLAGAYVIFRNGSWPDPVRSIVMLCY